MSTTDNLLDGSSFTRKETKSYPGASLREVHFVMLIILSGQISKSGSLQITRK